MNISFASIRSILFLSIDLKSRGSIEFPNLNLNRPLDARKFLFFRIFKNQNSDLKRLFLTEKMEEPEFLKDPGITEPLDDHLGPFILISDWLSRHEPSYSLTAIQSESIFIN